ncbi:chemotaxis protein CheW [Candidatus Dependentiae bacterium]|nr:chemotaxis protein CheW [Candidatus Dependentiae bacterium]
METQLLTKKNEIANNKNTEKKEENSKHVVTFNIGKEEYAIDIMLIIEIIKSTKITPVPLSLDFVKGVVNLRGKVVPVVDLKKKFSIKYQENPKDIRFIVVEIEKKVIGFQVDKVKEVISIPLNLIDPTPSIVSGISQNYIEGVARINDRLIILLNIEKLLSEKELEKLSL